MNKYTILEISDNIAWEEFIDENCITTFMQSVAYGEFDKNIGKHQVFRWGVYNQKNELCALAQGALIEARRGKYLYLAHAPIFDLSFFGDESAYIHSLELSLDEGLGENNIRKVDKIADISNIMEKFRLEWVRVASEANCSFVRLGSTLPNLPETHKMFLDKGFVKSHTYLNSENAFVIDISGSEEEILKKMRKTHRNLIRRELDGELEIEVRKDKKAQEIFLDLYQKTVEREGFRPFSASYIRGEFEYFLVNNRATYLLGKQKSLSGWEYTGAALLLFTKKGAFYHQGASVHSKLPVMYKLHFEGIREAKSRGCKFYNMWGVEKKGRTPKGWEGLSSFKYGFGGEVWDYAPTQDIILSKKYYLTKLIEKITKIL